LKVLIINDYDAAIGGAERFLTYWMDSPSENRIAYTRLNLANTLGGSTRPVTGSMHAKWKQVIVQQPIVELIRKCIYRESPDIIHLNTCYLYTASVFKAVLASALPVTCFLHDFHMLSRFRLWWFDSEYRQMQFISHNPEAHRRLVHRNYQSHLVQVPFVQEKWKVTVHHHEQRHDMLYVGRLETGKGVFELLKAMPLIVRAIPHASLTMVGDGSQAGAIRKWIQQAKLEKHIVLAGHHADEDVLQFYNSASCLVLPSRQESLGYVGLEALACGLPVVAFENPGTVRWCRHSENGILVKRYSSRDLAHALIELLSNPGLLAALAENAQRGATSSIYDVSSQRMEDVFFSMQL
jgi:glycosyltransferase involved in cell wall biosynthesis